MEFFDSPVFMYCYSFFLVIIINTCPYFVSWEDSNFWRLGMPLFVSAVFVIGYLEVLWSLTDKFFMVFVVIFAVSYVHFCFTIKKRVHFKLYTIIFIIISLFFVIWTTAMFGQYYMNNDLIDVSNYIAQYDAIIDTNNWFPIVDFQLSVLFFNISFEKYFILPDEISLKNPFFVQFIFGVIVSGTIISWSIDVIKHAITPSKPN